jgi:hypothetical protein
VREDLKERPKFVDDHEDPDNSERDDTNIQDLPRCIEFERSSMIMWRRIQLEDEVAELRTCEGLHVCKIG